MLFLTAKPLSLKKIIFSQLLDTLKYVKNTTFSKIIFFFFLHPNKNIFNEILFENLFF